MFFSANYLQFLQKEYGFAQIIYM